MGILLNPLSPAQLSGIIPFLRTLRAPTEATSLPISLFEASLRVEGKAAEEFSALVGRGRLTAQTLRGIEHWISANPEVSLRALNRIPRPLFAVPGSWRIEESLDYFLSLSEKFEKATATSTVGASSSFLVHCSSNPDGSDGNKSGKIPPTYRSGGLARVERLKGFLTVFESDARSLEERIQAIESFEDLTVWPDVDQSLRTLLKFSQRRETKSLQRDDHQIGLDLERALLRSHALTAILRLLERGQLRDKKSILAAFLDGSLSRDNIVSELVHLEEDWPSEDPHRIAPYLIDLNRPTRLLLGEVLDELTKELNLDPDALDDQELQIRANQARTVLEKEELIIRRHLSRYDGQAHRPSRREKIGEWLNTRPVFSAVTGTAAVVGGLMGICLATAMTMNYFVFVGGAGILIASAVFWARFLPEPDEKRWVAKVLEKHRNLYLRLPIRPESSSLHRPIAVQPSRRIETPRRVEIEEEASRQAAEGEAGETGPAENRGRRGHEK